MIELLVKVVRQNGAGLVLISHHEDTVERIADAVVRLTTPCFGGCVIVSVKDLVKTFEQRGTFPWSPVRYVHAVQGVDIQVAPVRLLRW